jgi:hypothetical protein
MIVIQWALLFIGLATLFRGDWLVARQRAQRTKRLAQIQAGAPEGFFEERRELSAYPTPGSAWRMRLFGAAISVAMATALFLGRG